MISPDNLNQHARELYSSGIRSTLCVPLDVNPVRFGRTILMVRTMATILEVNHMKKRVVFLATVVSILMVRTPVNSQQKMDPVDFKPFVDGRTGSSGSP